VTVKYTTKTAPIQGGENFEKISDKLSENLFEKTAVLKDEVDNLIVGQLQLSTSFLQRLQQDLANPMLTQVLMQLPIGTKDQINQYFADMGVRLKGSGLDLDHMDITYVNTRTALIINLLQGELARQQGGNTYIDTSDTASQADIDRSQMLGSIARGGTPMLKNVIVGLQRNLAISEKLMARIDANMGGSTLDYNAVINQLNQQGQVTIDKQKFVDALDGKAIATFRYVPAVFNRKVKGVRQLVAGSTRQAILSGKNTLGTNVDPVVKAEGDKFIQKMAGVAFTVSGSKSIEEGLIAQLEANFLARKAKVQKDKRRVTKTKRTTHKKAKTALKKFDLKKTEAIRAITGVQRRAQIDNKAKRYDTDGQNTQKHLNNLRLAINAKLSAKVKQNMGRPGLENQTGTFAGSVRLESLQAPRGAKTIVGEYSYQYAPYETFENSNRWPTGYNPKPLITKSIRELATKQLAMKFTLKKL
tara:strand:- start:513 stop:1931 length:1419 start_codon:yes stop_codon:yes gene_type:complete